MREKFGLKRSTDDELRAMVVWLSSGRDAAIDAPLGHDNDFTIVDRLAAPEEAADDAVEAEWQAFVGPLSEGMKPREASIFWRRLLAEDPATLKDLGAEMELTRERVRQIEARLIGRLRRAVERDPQPLALLRPSQRARVLAALAEQAKHAEQGKRARRGAR